MAVSDVAKGETRAGAQFNVGGVELAQPFKIRRLGHFGLNVSDLEGALRFYGDLLGFRVSDYLDFGRIAPEALAGLQETRGIFMRHGTDHHSFVLFAREAFERLSVVRSGGLPVPSEVTINQLTWQVGSLQEVHDGITWFAEKSWTIGRTGRDMPGSNWHLYMPAPDGTINELYYGMEQVGWDGYSKPREMHNRRFEKTPDLPQPSELAEVEAARSDGVDLHSGHRHLEALPATYNVDGQLLPRPFKIVRHGPVGLFVEDLEANERFYVERLGFDVTERGSVKGHTCVFLRCNTEHHSLALFPLALRAELPVSQGTKLASFGLQVATYRQLQDAVRFLEEQGCRAFDLPPEMHPGIDHAAYIQDPAGHTLQLYFQMEQIGWDGRPRPASQRRPALLGAWPEVLAAQSDTYRGEPYLGPWG